MKYRCLVLDHDDTSVKSTAAIHYPAHLETLRRLRPHIVPPTLEEWFLKNYSPGILTYLKEELGLSQEDLAKEFSIWQEYTQTRTPLFFSGLRELFKEFSAQGGILAVVSHSEVSQIQRHYREAGMEVEPTYIYGWDQNAERRKPHPWPMEQILEKTGLSPKEVLMVDDLLPGVEMAKAAGVDVAAAGWGHKVPLIIQSMREKCDFWLESVQDLRKLVLG